MITVTTIINNNLRKQYNSIISKLKGYEIYNGPLAEETLNFMSEQFDSSSVAMKKHIIFNLKSQYNGFQTIQYNQ